MKVAVSLWGSAERGKHVQPSTSVERTTQTQCCLQAKSSERERIVLQWNNKQQQQQQQEREREKRQPKQPAIAARC